jgi:hypothetical protein
VNDIKKFLAKAYEVPKYQGIQSCITNKSSEKNHGWVEYKQPEEDGLRDGRIE